jgi:hypothetical protein
VRQFPVGICNDLWGRKRKQKKTKKRDQTNSRDPRQNKEGIATEKGKEAFITFSDCAVPKRKKMYYKQATETILQAQKAYKAQNALVTEAEWHDHETYGAECAARNVHPEGRPSDQFCNALVLRCGKEPNGVFGLNVHNSTHWGMLLAELGVEEPRTWQMSTPGVPGFTLFFEHDADIPLHYAIAHHVQVRCRSSGYRVNIPPSAVSIVQPRWTTGRSPADLKRPAKVPGWLLMAFNIGYVPLKELVEDEESTFEVASDEDAQ